MNAKFHPALKAIREGDVEKFRALVAADPSLVKDTKVGSTVSGWADYGAHAEICDLLV